MKRTAVETITISSKSQHNNGVCPGLLQLSQKQLNHLYDKIHLNLTGTIGNYYN